MAVIPSNKRTNSSARVMPERRECAVFLVSVDATKIFFFVCHGTEKGKHSTHWSKIIRFGRMNPIRAIKQGKHVSNRPFLAAGALEVTTADDISITSHLRHMSIFAPSFIRSKSANHFNHAFVC